jgi:hypothetical protein
MPGFFVLGALEVTVASFMEDPHVGQKAADLSIAPPQDWQKLWFLLTQLVCPT